MDWDNLSRRTDPESTPRFCGSHNPAIGALTQNYPRRLGGFLSVSLRTDQYQSSDTESDTLIRDEEVTSMGHTSEVLDLSVIIIDDNLDHLNLMSATLDMAFESDSVELTTLQYDNPANALAELADIPNQIILIDYQFAGSTGLD